MNEVIKAIGERRAVRKYKEAAVSKDLIGQLLEAGMMAPSAMNRQPWKFHVVTDKATMSLFSKEIVKEAIKSIPAMGVKKIAKAVVSGITHLSHGIEFFKAPDPVFHGAPAVIFITASKEDEWAALDIGMCAQNMMLAAKSLGLDSCPVGFGKFVEKSQHYALLAIPASEQVHLAVIFGFGDETPEAPERIKSNIFYL